MDSMRTTADAADEMPPNRMGADMNVTLDKSNPDVADAFNDCEPGEMLKVVRNDESEIVLAKVGYGDGMDDKEPMPNKPEPGEETVEDENAEPPMSTGNPAVDRVMRKRQSAKM